MAPIVASLLASGLNLLGNAVMSKGQEVIEEKLGVKLGEPKSPEDVLRLKQLEVDHEEFLIEAGIRQKEQELEEIRIANENTEGARKMNSTIQTSEHASDLAKNAAYYLDFLVVGSTVFLGLMLFMIGLPPENKDIAQIIFGSLLTLSGTIINFHRGTSHSSSKKDETIKALSGDAK